VSQPGAIAVGDLNGDGMLDVVLFQYPDSNQGFSLYALFGNGNGTFKSPQMIASVPSPTRCTTDPVLSDFNGDGIIDLAICTSTQIGILLGRGDGSFQPPVFYTVSSTSGGDFSYAAGDFNSDGKTDLVVSRVGDFQFLLLLGNGDGTFQTPQSINVGQSDGETGIVVGDFNSDGLLDFVFQNNGMVVYTQK
jgi:hypothetical protein